MFESEKQFLEWLLDLINFSHTVADMLDSLARWVCVDFEKRTTSIGTFIAIATVINGKPYVYSFFFENENDVKSDTFQLKQLKDDINQYEVLSMH